MALAGAEAAAVFTASGPGRFAACQKFIDETLEHAVAVGDLSAPFSGPLFFAAFAFFDQVEPGEVFPAATLFVPRWQVAHQAGRTVAVANLSIDAGSPVDALAERVWRAHAKFSAFDYAAPDFASGAPPRAASARRGIRAAMCGVSAAPSGTSEAEPSRRSCWPGPRTWPPARPSIPSAS